MKKKIFSINSPVGEPITLYKNSWEGSRLLETLTIVCGLHGDRLNGIYTASKLSRFLQEVYDGLETDYKLAGTVEIIPIVNFKAVESGGQVWSFDNLDADLAFPGTETGEVTEKLCNAILNHTTSSTYGIILETGEKHYEDYPQVRLFNADRPLRNLAGALGLDIAREISDEPPANLSLASHWLEYEVQTLVISAGKPNALDREVCDKLFDGLVNFMLATGLITHHDNKGKKSNMTFYNRKSETTLLSGQAGLFLPEICVGDKVQSGQKLGEIRDLYSGETLEEIIAPEDGLAVTLREHPVVFESEPLVILVGVKGRKWYWPFG